VTISPHFTPKDPKAQPQQARWWRRHWTASVSCYQLHSSQLFWGTLGFPPLQSIFGYCPGK